MSCAACPAIIPSLRPRVSAGYDHVARHGLVGKYMPCLAAGSLMDASTPPSFRVPSCTLLLRSVDLVDQALLANYKVQKERDPNHITNKQLSHW